MEKKYVCPYEKIKAYAQISKVVPNPPSLPINLIPEDIRKLLKPPLKS